MKTAPESDGGKSIGTEPKLADYSLADAAKAVQMSDVAFRELEIGWKEFCEEHADEDPLELQFEYELFPSRVGITIVQIEPEETKLKLTVIAGDPETGEEIVLHDPVPEDAWIPCLPVEGIVAEKRIPPNAKCPCGSGKKHKKCCGSAVPAQKPGE